MSSDYARFKADWFARSKDFVEAAERRIEAKLTEGMAELPWPEPHPDSWSKARPHSHRRGSFIEDPETPEEIAERDRIYRKRRLKCAMAELYWNFALWRDAKSAQRELHLQAAIRAHHALKALGAEKTFRRRDVS